MGFGTCRRMWCGECYTLSPTHKFHVADPNDNNGEPDDDARIESGWKERKDAKGKYYS